MPAEFLTLSCPSCGGKLELTEDVERFACAYCGAEHVVRRGGGIVSIKPVVAGLARVQVGTDRTAAELAIVRLEKEIEQARFALSRFMDGYGAFFDHYRQTTKKLQGWPPGPVTYEEIAQAMNLTELERPSSGLKGMVAAFNGRNSPRYRADAYRFLELVGNLRQLQIELDLQRRIVMG